MICNIYSNSIRHVQSTLDSLLQQYTPFFSSLYNTTSIYTLQSYFPLHKASSSHCGCGADSEHKAILVKRFCADKRFWLQHFAAPSAQYSCYAPTLHKKLPFLPSIFNKASGRQQSPSYPKSFGYHFNLVGSTILAFYINLSSSPWELYRLWLHQRATRTQKRSSVLISSFSLFTIRPIPPHHQQQRWQSADPNTLLIFPHTPFQMFFVPLKE